MLPVLQSVINDLRKRDPMQYEFHQAVEEVWHAVNTFLEHNPRYCDQSLLESLVEPERIIIFRIPWVDDNGRLQVNRGYRVQMNSAIGPYKGGLRFHPSVNLSVLKFLAFEQTFKNALTTLPLGSAKGGADFDPKGKSDNEVRRFCQSMMNELYRHIGPTTDIPAGDIGVGAREIGYLYGQYRRLNNLVEQGVITGKGLAYGGSRMRTEATGYGLIYFIAEMLAHIGDGLKGKTVCISGSGNVAQYAAEKLLNEGAKVLSLSDSGGTLYVKDGLTREMLETIKQLKNEERGRLEQWAEQHNLTFYSDQRPWQIACDIALPCATQNELELDDAKALITNDCQLVAEGANMPCSNDAIIALQKHQVLYAPGKASNAGGVATSGLEMTQNRQGYFWPAEQVDAKLREIMQQIHADCLTYSPAIKGTVDYQCGANVAGFVKVADAMIAQGYL
ncbi:NADP-specific glutamate dehydrogenase [Suttonella sp. R2A3]|uniref:NADP-specific glutamate dehydrogenase n=1 Tax=Suttonella sp. R2A3 TaxID=2908648 RepID=UPI001F339394|nr:NADP-specific glutamate dehydrogenase [Suttonella sp. R2A3]UJF25046.1 NADP-specific glutamate dehydrogenase [Suttonella sp. R2A3]